MGRPTDVGSYPTGNTTDGISDLAGNVWEWCLDAYTSYEENPRRGDGLRAARGADRVLRGGSFRAGGVRASIRSRGGLDFRNDWVGFRLARLSTE